MLLANNFRGERFRSGGQRIDRRRFQRLLLECLDSEGVFLREIELEPERITDPAREIVDPPPTKGT